METQKAGSTRTYIDTSRYWNVIAFPFFIVIMLFGLYTLFSAPKGQRVSWNPVGRLGRPSALPSLKYQ